MTGRKIDNYYRKNFLYRSHTMMLPEMQQKVTHTCKDCLYLVTVQGKHENKLCCVKDIDIYGNKTKAVPRQVSIYHLLKYISGERLLELVEKSSPHKVGCGKFQKL
ncbi:hypothetical protein [Desulfofalx alkaliphila]|uniref:hypothetical protein n=1 Tax=Desulfofalx alkaliphila TaxID=105483 RepID=UPI0004E26B07|nr:hypothetical protein [Desulfofalx alkaliphila]